jgi:hypothetical protein
MKVAHDYSYSNTKTTLPKLHLVVLLPIETLNSADMVAAQKNVATRDITIRYGGIAPDGGNI